MKTNRITIIKTQAVIIPTIVLIGGVEYWQ